MSAILAIVSADRAHTDPQIVGGMQAAMAMRGHDRTELWEDDGVVLAVQRYAWETTRDFAGPALLVVTPDAVVAADARLYYRRDLQRALADRGVVAADDSPAQLVLAAWRAHGERCADVLEGDFAFVVWDRQRRRLIASRDFSGVRPLFRATWPSAVAYASTVGALRAHPACPASFDLATLAADAAGLMFSVGDGTAYSAIRQVGAGSTDVVERFVVTSRRWFTLPAREGRPRNQDDAAMELRTLLVDAVRERMALEAPTTVWMSGGYDSTAVAGTLRDVVRHAGGSMRLVSLSYPEGNSGREDELIADVAQHLGLPVHWVQGGELPPIPPDAAAGRDEGYVHLHEAVQDTLAHGTRAQAARVALHGHAGDFLFQCNAWFLSDLLRRGQLPALWREWQALGLTEQRGTWFWKYAVEPALPAAVVQTLGTARGRRFTGQFERLVPPWLKTAGARATGAFDTTRVSMPDHRTYGAVHGEFRWYLESPGFTRLSAVMNQGILSHGVEARSPFHDLRVVRFAAAGTRAERFANGETKLLLRRAMRGVLPPSVLQRRDVRTGTLATRFDQSVTRAAAWLRAHEHEWHLTGLGLLDGEVLRRQLEGVERGVWRGEIAESIIRTAHVESFLRATASESTHTTSWHARTDGPLDRFAHPVDASMVGASHGTLLRNTP